VKSLKNTSRKLRLRTALVVPFILQIVAAVGLVGYLSFRSGQRAINDLANQLQKEINNRVNHHLEIYLKMPQRLNQINHDIIQIGLLDVNNFSASRQYLWRLLQRFETISYIGFGNEQEKFIGVERLEGGKFSVEIKDESTGVNKLVYLLDKQGNLIDKQIGTSKNYLPTRRPWYRAAKEANKPTWGKIYQFSSDSAVRLGIPAVQPYRDKAGNFVGVLVTDLVISQIGNFLNQIKISPSGGVFIMTKLQQLDFKINGERQFVLVEPWQDEFGLNWVIVTAVRESDFMSQINANTRTTILLCLATLILAIAIGILTARSITRPVLRITKAAEQIAAGNFDKRVGTTDFIEIEEIDTLERSFDSMAGQLKESFETLEDKVKERTTELASANGEILALNERLKEDNLRMGAQLDIVRQMQQMILPNAEELEIDGLDIAGYMEAADEVGGDYYDVLNTDGVVTLGIGDVTGHGLESGILMLMAQTAVRTLKEIRETDPVRFLDALNRTLYKNVQRMNSEKSLTLAILNYSQGRVSISGQHEETIIVRNGGEVERIDTMDLGFPIALDDDIAEFISHISIELQLGDGIVLYTDGIPEAKDINKKQYGVEQMCEVISQNWHLSAQEIKQAVIDDLRGHIGTQKVFDDITLLVVKRTQLGVEKKSQPQAAALV
jgi:sigma-B regulation protein RsbU (phosphoserine phosphatase)